MWRGFRQFTRAAFEQISSEWDPCELAVDLSQQQCVVTGANSGIGLEVTRALLQRGATVHMICRSEQKGAAARQQLADELVRNQSDLLLDNALNRVQLHVADVSRPRDI
jgi:dehydrogenase/reductase SDR family member 12